MFIPLNIQFIWLIILINNKSLHLADIKIRVDFPNVILSISIIPKYIQIFFYSNIHYNKFNFLFTQTESIEMPKF